MARVVQLAYEAWRRHGQLPPWDELTIREADIAVNMWRAGVDDAATVVEVRDPNLAQRLRKLLS